MSLTLTEEHSRNSILLFYEWELSWKWHPFHDLDSVLFHFNKIMNENRTLKKPSKDLFQNPFRILTLLLTLVVKRELLQRVKRKLRAPNNMNHEISRTLHAVASETNSSLYTDITTKTNFRLIRSAKFEIEFLKSNWNICMKDF